MARILAVDDDLSVRMLVQTLLTQQGHEVVLAAGGAEALETLDGGGVELVLLDIMMPEMDGYEVLARIPKSERGAGVPVIVVTAKHDAEGLRTELLRGAVDHVVKPLTPDELGGAVERALHGSDADRGERRRQLETQADVYASMDELYSRDDDERR